MTSEHSAARDATSRAEVDVSDKASLQRWAEALGTTGDALESAILAVGTRIDRIKDQLIGKAADQAGG